MATHLNKIVTRLTDATVFDRGQFRELVITLEPVRDGAMIGFRLKGTRDVYRVGVGSLHTLAVNHHLGKIERRARQIHKDEKLPMRSARARARRELAKDLKPSKNGEKKDDTT